MTISHLRNTPTTGKSYITWTQPAFGRRNLSQKRRALCSALASALHSLANRCRCLHYST